MKKQPIAVVVLVFLALFLRCTVNVSDRNGTGTEAGEAKLMGKVLTKSSSPIYGAEVILHCQYLNSSSLMAPDTTFSDVDGAYSFSDLNSGYYVVSVSSGDTLMSMKQVTIQPADSVITKDISLNKPVSFTGYVFYQQRAVVNAKVQLTGLDYVTNSSANGNFSFDKLPDGTYTLTIVQDSQDLKGEFVVSKSNNNDTFHIQSVPITILEDFDKFTWNNKIGQMMGDGFWFTAIDSASGGKSVIHPIYDSGFNAAIIPTDSSRGKSLHCSYAIDTSFVGAFSLVGFNVSDDMDGRRGRSVFNLRAMSTFKFRAKGSGKIIVEFVTKVGSSTVRFPVSVTLNSTWTQHSISSDSILSNNTIPWNLGVSSVNGFTFKAIRNAELWLDDIAIEGMYPQDFFGAAK